MFHYTVAPIARWLASGVILAMLAACGPGGEGLTGDPPTGGGTQPANRAPTLTGDGGATITVRTAYTFTPTASDPDGNSLAFSVTGKPAWLTFNTNTGALSGTPAASDAGVFNLTITASDGSLSASLSFAVTVNPAPTPPPSSNRAPTISGSGAASINVGQAYSFTPTASDPDGNALVYSITGKPAWATFNSMNGALTGTANAAGTSNVTISVSDGSLSASVSFTVTVIQPNRAPSLSGTGGATVNVGSAYSFTPTASDPDGNRLTFAITGKPTWATFSTSTGALTGTPAAGNVGTSNVTITASDGSLSASISFTITVVQQNRAPTITGNGTRTVAIGTAYSFTPTASDPDGNTLTYSITGKPAWLTFTASNGALSGTPAAADTGAFPMTITVSDGTLSATLNLTVTVSANGAPTISGNGTRTVTVGSAYSFTPTASDPENATLTFSITGKPTWLTFSTTTGALTGTPAAADVGAYAMTITVSDGSQSATLSVTVTVAAAATGNATLNWTAPTQRTDGTALSTLAGYRIYYGTSAGSLTSRVDVTNPSLTTYVVEGLAAGTWYFAATAVDAAGLESVRTSTVSLTIN